MSAGVNTGPFHEEFFVAAGQYQARHQRSLRCKGKHRGERCLTIARITEQYLIDTSTNERTLLSHGDMQSLVGLMAPLMGCSTPPLIVRFTA
jgi:hypothetical protein